MQKSRKFIIKNKQNYEKYISQQQTKLASVHCAKRELQIIQAMTNKKTKGFLTASSMS